MPGKCGDALIMGWGVGVCVRAVRVSPACWDRYNGLIDLESFIYESFGSGLPFPLHSQSKLS